MPVYVLTQILPQDISRKFSHLGGRLRGSTKIADKRCHQQEFALRLLAADNARFFCAVRLGNLRSLVSAVCGANVVCNVTRKCVSSETLDTRDSIINLDPSTYCTKFLAPLRKQRLPNNGAASLSLPGCLVWCLRFSQNIVSSHYFAVVVSHCGQSSSRSGNTQNMINTPLLV